MQEILMDEYVAIDLHVHTPASSCYNRKCGNIEDDYLELIDKYVNCGVKIIAITDHNSIQGYKNILKIKQEAETRIKFWNELADMDGIYEKIEREKQKLKKLNGLMILPGVEFEAFPGIHLLFVFDSNQENVVKIIEDFLNENGYSEEVRGNENVEGIIISAIEAVNRAKELGAITIAAHIDSDKGALEKLKDSGRVQFFKNENLDGVQIVSPETIEYMKKLMNNVSYKREKNLSYMRFSDFHNKADIEGKFSYFRMSSTSFEEVKNVICNHPELVSFTPRIEDVDLIERVLSMSDTIKFENFKLQNIDDICKSICAILNKGKGTIVVGVGKQGTINGMKMSTSEVENNISNIISKFIEFEAFYKYSYDIYELGDFCVTIIRIWAIGHRIFEYNDTAYIYNEKMKIMNASTEDIYTLGENNYKKSFKKINDVNNARIHLIQNQMEILQNTEQNVELNRKIHRYSVDAEIVFDINVNIADLDIEYNNDGLGLEKGNLYWVSSLSDAHYGECYNRITCPSFLVEERDYEKYLDRVLKEPCGVVNRGFATHYIDSVNDYLCAGRLSLLFKFKKVMKESYSLLAEILWLKSPIFLYYLKTIYGDYTLKSPRIFNDVPILMHNEMRLNGEVDIVAQKMINKEKEFLRQKEGVEGEELDKLMQEHNNSILFYVYEAEKSFIKMLDITTSEYKMILDFCKEEGWNYFDESQ